MTDLVWLAVCSVIPAKSACKDNAKLCALVELSCRCAMLLFFSVKEVLYEIKRHHSVYRRNCRASLISHMEKGLHIKTAILVSFIFGVSCSGGESKNDNTNKLKASSCFSLICKQAWDS